MYPSAHLSSMACCAGLRERPAAARPETAAPIERIAGEQQPLGESGNRPSRVERGRAARLHNGLACWIVIDDAGDTVRSKGDGVGGEAAHASTFACSATKERMRAATSVAARGSGP